MPPKFKHFFNNKQYLVKDFLIYDPDTLNLVITIENTPVTFPARLKGFDAVEKKIIKQNSQTLNNDDKQLLHQKYQESLTLLQNTLDKKLLKVQCGELDLYGRILVEIFVEENGKEISVNKKMIESKLVFEYNGETKKTLQQQLEFFK